MLAAEKVSKCRMSERLSPSSGQRHVKRCLMSVLVLLIFGVTLHLCSVLMLLLKPLRTANAAVAVTASLSGARWEPVGHSDFHRACLPLGRGTQASAANAPVEDQSPKISPLGSEILQWEFGRVIMQRVSETGTIDGWLLQTDLSKSQLADALAATSLFCSPSVDGKEFYVRTASDGQFQVILGTQSSGGLVITVLRVGAY